MRGVQSRLVAYGLAVALAVLVCGARGVGYLQPLEYRLQDLWMRLGAGTASRDCPCLIIAIDQPSLDELQLPFTLWRPQMAQVVQNLRRAGAKVIGLDVVFALRPETFSRYGPEYLPLQRSLAAAERTLAAELFEGPVVLAAHLSSQGAR